MKSPDNHKLRSDKREWLLFASFLIIAGIAIRLVYGEGLYYADDFAYVNAAFDANQNGWLHYLSSISDIYENRISIVLPVAFFMKLFGNTEGAIQSLSLCFSMGIILCTFLTGTILYNYRYGWIAAFFVAFIPQDIWFSTCTLPDTFVPFYTGFSFLCLVTGLRYSHKNLIALLLYLLSGFFVFCAFEARATSGMLIFPLSIFAVWSKHRQIKAVILPSAAFFAILGAFWLFLFLMNGDFFLQFKLLVHDAVGTRWTGTGTLLGHALTMMPLLKLFSGQLILFTSDFGILFYLACPAFLYAAYFSKNYECCKFSLVSFLLIYLFFEFGSTSLTSYKMIWKQERFLTILSMSTSLLIAFPIEHLFYGKQTFRYQAAIKKLIVFFSVAYLLASCLSLVLVEMKRYSSIPAYQRTFAKIKNLDAGSDNRLRIFITHWRWELRGNVYMRLTPSRACEFLPLKGVPIDSIHNAVVIFDTSFFTKFGTYKVSWNDVDPAFRHIASRLPAGWKPLFIEYRPLIPNKLDAEIFVFWVP